MCVGDQQSLVARVARDIISVLNRNCQFSEVREEEGDKVEEDHLFPFLIINFMESQE